MDGFAVSVAALFGVIGLLLLATIPFGLPGTWFALGLAVALELARTPFGASGAPAPFGWPLIGLGVALAALGEGIEFAAGAMGARWGGGTRRGVVGALVGGIAGAVLGTAVIPIPLVGTLCGAVLGSFGGALLGELTAEKRRHPHENLRAALAAALGRLAGSFAKLGIGVVIWAVLLRSAIGAATAGR